MKTSYFIYYATSLFITILLVIQTGCKKEESGNPAPPTSTVTDPRDGHVYKTITMDSLTWFAENLDFDTTGAYDIPGRSTSADSYGKLYAYYSALTACPDGWHLSKKSEWSALFMHMGMSGSDAGLNNGFVGTDEGKRLKSTTGWENNHNGTDEIGFTIYPAGERSVHGDFEGQGLEATFWTSTEFHDDNNFSYSFTDRDDVRFGNLWTKSDYAVSVRCVKNHSKK